jgi:hypothetical protein
MKMELGEAISEIGRVYKEKYGQMEIGDEAAFVLNDAVVIWSLGKGRKLGVHIIAGEPDRLDITLDLIEKRAGK